jgi:hypothetical protein
MLGLALTAGLPACFQDPPAASTTKTLDNVGRQGAAVEYHRCASDAPLPKVVPATPRYPKDAHIEKALAAVPAPVLQAFFDDYHGSVRRQPAIDALCPGEDILGCYRPGDAADDGLEIVLKATDPDREAYTLVRVLGAFYGERMLTRHLPATGAVESVSVIGGPFQSDKVTMAVTFIGELLADQGSDAAKRETVEAALGKLGLAPGVLSADDFAARLKAFRAMEPSLQAGFASRIFTEAFHSYFCTKDTREFALAHYADTMDLFDRFARRLEPRAPKSTAAAASGTKAAAAGTKLHASSDHPDWLDFYRDDVAKRRASGSDLGRQASAAAARAARLALVDEQDDEVDGDDGDDGDDEGSGFALTSSSKSKNKSSKSSKSSKSKSSKDKEKDKKTDKKTSTSTKKKKKSSSSTLSGGSVSGGSSTGGAGSGNDDKAVLAGATGGLVSALARIFQGGVFSPDNGNGPGNGLTNGTAGQNSLWSSRNGLGGGYGSQGSLGGGYGGQGSLGGGYGGQGSLGGGYGGQGSLGGGTGTGFGAGGGSGATGDLSAEERSVVDLTNQERARNGLPALQVSAQLMARTREYAQDVANRGAANEHSGDNVYENACCAPPSPLSANAAVEQWIESPSHHSNMLQEGISQIGVGEGSSNGQNYWYQQFQ